MRFRLSYEGSLPSTQDDPTRVGVTVSETKMRMRRHFHAQFKELWETDPMLKNAKVMRADYGISKQYSSSIIDDGAWGNPEPLWDVIASKHQEHGFRFVPLVRHAARLTCSINVTALVRDPTASIFTKGADLDNRIKTLVDCLRKPERAAELGKPDANGNYPQPMAGENPFYTLLESDRLVTAFSVDTDGLLAADFMPSDQSAVKLMIAVEIRPYDVGTDNIMFA